MGLLISTEQLEQIHDHACQSYPQECCGLMVGQAGRVMAIYPMENAWQPDVMPELSHQHSPRDRYWIDPAAMLAVMKQARAEGMEIMGVYHSHPDHPAMPSTCDREMAWAHYFYVIVAVQRGRVVDTKCWQLDDAQQFQSIVMTVVPAL